MSGSTSFFTFPYPTGTDLVIDGDNAIKALADRLELKVVRHKPHGNSIDPASAAPTQPDALTLQVGGAVQVNTNASGIGLLTYATPFPNGLLAVFAQTLSGTASPAIVNAGAATKTGVQLYFSGATTITVTVSYLAIGW